MKKLVVALAVGLVAFGALAQGRVTLNNTSRLVYLDSGSEKIAYAGGAVAALGGASLVADLYVGSSAETLVYSGITAASWSGAANPGIFANATGNLPAGFAGGTTTKWFFQVEVRPSTVVPAALAPLTVDAGAAGFGYSQVFQAFASSSALSANSLTATGTPSFSTWAVGQTAITGATAANANFGAIPVLVPEPSSMVLAGLGAAAMLIFRRRS